MNTVFGFIGTGNMGGALAHTVSKSPDASLLLSDFDRNKAEALAADLHAKAVDNDTIAKTADYIFLGVKPQMMGELLKSIAAVLKERTTPFVLVSMAAGLTMETIRTMAGTDVPIIRIMPNTPCSIGEGMILYDATANTTADALSRFVTAISHAGRSDRLPEPYIDAASAVSGCGPAFVYLFIEALADGAVLEGLPRDKAFLYAASAVAGSARMVLETGLHPGVLKDAVCSPGGSTIAGIHALESSSFRAAAKKTKDLR